MTPSTQSNARAGFSLVEVLVSVTLLSFVMMGVGGAATLGLAQM